MLEPELDITGVDLVERPATRGRSCGPTPAEGLPFADREFDLVYCSSVIEHVPPARRRGVRRGAASRRARLVRADARLLLPDRAPLAAARARTGSRVRLRRRYWRLGATGGWEDISLLRRRELEALFGAARAERFGPLAKSWVCVSRSGG